MKTLRWTASLFILLGALAALPRLARAHAGLVSADPAPDSRLAESPLEIRLTFTEALLAGSTFNLYAASGPAVSGLAPVIDGADLRASLPAPLANGLYRVEWKAVVEDGETQGKYTFRVGPLVEPAWLWGGGIAVLLAAAGGLAWWLRRRG